MGKKKKKDCQAAGCDWLGVGRIEIPAGEVWLCRPHCDEAREMPRRDRASILADGAVVV